MDLLKNCEIVIGENNIYLNETNDFRGRYVLNILIGIFNGEVQEAYLLHTKFLQQTNSETVTQATIEALNSLWTNLQFSKVRLLLTDYAPYTCLLYTSPSPRD